MRIKKTYFIILCLLYTFSCKKEEEKTDIPFPKMVQILKEQHLVEAGFHVDNKTETDKKSLGTQYYAEILKKHGFTSKQFEEAKVFYNNHPQLMDSIYAVMIREMNIPVDTLKN